MKTSTCLSHRCTASEPKSPHAFLWTVQNRAISLTSRRAMFQSDLCLPAPESSEGSDACQMSRLLLLSSK